MADRRESSWPQSWFGHIICNILQLCAWNLVTAVRLWELANSIRMIGWFMQGWEFAHRFSERIARFLPKNEWMSESQQNRAIHSFANFWWVTWAICSQSLIFGERPERYAHIAHFWWVTWAIHSHCSPKKRECAIRSFLKYKTYIKHTKKLDFRFF